MLIGLEGSGNSGFCQPVQLFFSRCTYLRGSLRYHAHRYPAVFASHPRRACHYLNPCLRYALRWQLLPPRAALRACAIIPVKDKAASLLATLAVLVAQIALAGQPLPADSFEVIVLANNCVDGTATAVRHFARQQPALVVYIARRLRLAAPDAHVGRAHRLLIDEACFRLLGLGHFNRFITSTYTDTCVAPD